MAAIYSMVLVYVIGEDHAQPQPTEGKIREIQARYRTLKIKIFGEKGMTKIHPTHEIIEEDSIFSDFGLAFYAYAGAYFGDRRHYTFAQDLKDKGYAIEYIEPSSSKNWQKKALLSLRRFNAI